MQSEQPEQLELYLFYSFSSQESLRAKFTVNEFLTNEPKLKNVKLVEVNYEHNGSLFKEHKVGGVPTMLVFINKELRVRHLGEFNHKELKTILTNAL